MAVSSKKFQAPKGMRDFYPQDMAVRRYIENIWRTVSINHGFDEVDGPTFEHLDLYTHKSGPGIVSEIFQVFSGKDEAERAAVQRTAQAPFALRPEFTPTLARMVAAQADSLPKPIKWFAIPTMFRAERPQRGRLREHVQWNVDFIGVPSEGMFRAQADVAMLALMVAAFERFGLSARDVRVKLGDREAVRRRLKLEGRDQAALDDDLTLLDERPKL
ncbi:MAG: ATP phosphoribosyltransferase regulatory subunit, partial [Phycisphaerales bacterium]|nr:ATP phosphoribosyltransferase regulatory subunit [Phycisphaerales bacterium]